MKKVLIIILIFSGVSFVSAQNETKSQAGYHKHDGFYLSMSAGPVFGTIRDNIKGSYIMDMSGAGGQFDLKIGGAIKENLLLHATLISSEMPGPRIKIAHGEQGKASNDLSIGEEMLGVGLTYYVMPKNIFFSGSIGIGSFSVSDNSSNSDYLTQSGFSMQLKVGKEWWISKNWGFGIGLTYGKTALTNNAGGGVEERLNSNRIAVLFNTTFN